MFKRGVLPSSRKLFAPLFIMAVIFSRTALAGDVALHEENGLLENLQVLLLLMSASAFLASVSRADKSYRCLLLAGAMLSVSFILREVDVEDFPVPEWVVAIGSGTGRNLILGAGWVMVGIWAGRSFSAIRENLKPIALSLPTRLFVVAGVLLLLGSFPDHMEEKTPSVELLEEALEVMGYVVFLLGAILTRFTAQSLKESTR